MQLEDQAKLKTSIEAALAESVATLKPVSRTFASPNSYALLWSQTWALVNTDCIRVFLTDRAVTRLGGTDFAVTIDDSGVTITAVTPAPAAPTAVPSSSAQG